jgi:hypothetical protein
VEAPTCALLELEVNTYILVERFQKILEWHLKPYPKISEIIG